MCLMYFKITGIQPDIMQTVIPGLVSPGLITVTNEQYKFQISRKKIEVISATVISYLNLCFVYVPIFFIIESVEYFQDYQSNFSIYVHIGTKVFYIIEDGVYPLLCGAFEEFGNPWRHIKTIPSSLNDHADSNQSRGSWTASTKMRYVVAIGGRDPVDPQSFLVRNQEEVKKKICKGKDDKKSY